MDTAPLDRAFWIFGYGSLIWKPDVVFDESCDTQLAGYVRRFWQSSPDHRGTPEHPGRVCTLVPVLCNCRSGQENALSAEAAVNCGTCRGHCTPPHTAAGLGAADSPPSTTSWGLLTSDLDAGELPVVQGTAYHVPAAHAAEQLAKLLHRESAGYDVVEADVVGGDGMARRALVFTATPENEHWAGPPGDSLRAETSNSGDQLERGFSRRIDAPPSPPLRDGAAPWGVQAVGDIIARSVGPSGRNTEYLSRLRAALTARGHPDPYLERLGDAVGAAAAAGAPATSGCSDAP